MGGKRIMAKYYKLTEKKAIDTVTEIPKEMWKRKDILPYEVIHITEYSDKVYKNSKIDIQKDKVVETFYRYMLKPTLDEIKNRKNSDIKSAYHDKTLGGFSCSNGIKLDCRESDKINWLVLKLNCQTNPDTKKTIKDFHNTAKELDNNEVAKMLKELEDYYSFLLYTKWEKQKEILNCISEEEVNSISWE